MKETLSCLVLFLLFVSSSPQDVKSLTTKDSITARPIIFPDTTIYNKPITPDLNEKVEQMINLRKEIKKVYQTSLHLRNAVEEEKKQAEIDDIRQGFELIKRNAKSNKPQ